jgi:hypothetical protein
MTKEQYKRLLQLRKSEEMMFYELIKIGKQTDLTPRDIINRMPINHKRAWYLLKKWCDKNLYEFGGSLDLGWIIEKR